MNLINVTKKFRTEKACLEYLEKLRWPNGLACLKCGSVKVSRLKLKDGRGKARLIYQCIEKECRHQFTATTGTLFHDTHLPLQKWFLAIALICESKKGMSASQISRALGIQYRTAWYLCHRIRKAMVEMGNQRLRGIVEIDETYLGPKFPRRINRRRVKGEKEVIVGLRERGGDLRLFHVPDAKALTLRGVIEDNVSPHVDAIMTDELAQYPWALQGILKTKHQAISHQDNYAIGGLHTNTIENAFSLLKRSFKGTFHKVSVKHLCRYLAEFCYRFNRRNAPDMFSELLSDLMGRKNLRYKQLTAGV